MTDKITGYDTDPNDLTKSYNENLKKRRIMDVNRTKLEKQTKYEKYEIRKKYSDQRSKIDIKEEAELEAVAVESETRKQKMRKLDHILSETGYKINEILYFLNVSKDSLNNSGKKKINQKSAGRNRNWYWEELERLVEDDLELGLYIAGNDRPKNQYSLVLLGNTRFEEKCMSKIFYRGMLDCFYTEGWTIEMNIIHFREIEDARTYHAKNQIKGILKKQLREHHILSEKYRHICNRYNLEDFEQARQDGFEDNWRYNSDLGDYTKDRITEKLGIPTINLAEMTQNQRNLLFKSEGKTGVGV